MSLSWWVGFNIFIIGMLVLDLVVFNRKEHVIKMKEALSWTAVWITLALVFNLWVYYAYGQEKALEFFTGYLIEKSLSIDNIFVFLMIFSYFRVPKIYQHKVLFWGVLGAIIMRTIFIVAGVSLIQMFHWTIYVFGFFLVLVGIKMLLQKDKEIDPENNPVIKLFRKIMPVTDTYEKDKFFIKKEGKYYATTLFIVLVVIETTDVIFAVDSIPAVLAITQDVFIVYTSNIFAILGLRALYFVLAEVMHLFHYLVYGLSCILVFVGIKMLISDFYKIDTLPALLVIAIVILVSITASIIFKKKEEKR
ncbi:MAG: hypothetical protein A2536_09320 [Candidatus Firestonebacteria bacterium RIFOXYD2_FULL_39_29]|nr:MAG: hypothetical protein A2536_09320 [Candidatus Firestonebacteria bacterium RIFOXYD2_FULL_39_29]